jgi:hypothetical protein
MINIEFNSSYILRIYTDNLGIQRYLCIEVAIFLRIPVGPVQILNRGPFILRDIFRGFSSVPSDKFRDSIYNRGSEPFLCHGSL